MHRRSTPPGRFGTRNHPSISDLTLYAFISWGVTIKCLPCQGLAHFRRDTWHHGLSWRLRPPSNRSSRFSRGCVPEARARKVSNKRSKEMNANDMPSLLFPEATQSAHYAVTVTTERGQGLLHHAHISLHAQCQETLGVFHVLDVSTA
jgi:hypothetical protein